jgi:hypothetical protein
MPKHRTPHPDLAGYVLGILEPAESAAFTEHLGECSACRAEVAELSALRQLLARAEMAVEPPADLRARTLLAVDALPVAAPRRRARMVTMASVAVAALFLAALGAAALLSRDTDRARTPVFTAQLAAVATGSGAHGTAQLRSTPSGVVVELEVSGLPPAEGSHYECWYVDAVDDATRISAGTFVTGEDGSAKVRMITAADPVRFPRIMVTREPDDGNPAPGEPVLST